MRNWQRDVHAHIAHAVKDLPADATLTQRRGALRAEAINFHGGTSWGKKVWSKHVRTYLEQHGLPPRPPLGNPLSTQGAKLAAPDITFPFRPAP